MELLQKAKDKFAGIVEQYNLIEGRSFQISTAHFTKHRKELDRIIELTRH